MSAVDPRLSRLLALGPSALPAAEMLPEVRALFAAPCPAAREPVAAAPGAPCPTRHFLIAGRLVRAAAGPRSPDDAGR